MHVLNQSVPKGHPSFCSLEQSAYWFWERGYEVTRFEFDELAAGRFDELLITDADSTVVRAGVGTVVCALERAGRTPPRLPDLPSELRKFVGRNVWETTMGDFRSAAVSSKFEPPIHVKPLLKKKLFTGVLVKRFRDLIPTAHIPDDTAVLCQERALFLSEWRCYVLRDRILHVGCYKGDPLLFPNAKTIRDAIPAFSKRPIAFGLDWGVTESGATLLVEVNDGFSLGNYGLSGHLYTAMIEARWRQMMGLPDNFVGVGLSSDMTPT